jgi:hypothetical protein
VKQPPVELVVPISVPAGASGRLEFGAGESVATFGSLGLSEYGVRLDVEISGAHGVAVTLVNTSEVAKAQEGTLFEVALELQVDQEISPFLLDSLPDSFRYDRRVPAYGIYGGVEWCDGVLRTTDIVTASRRRPHYWDEQLGSPVELEFAALADEPLAPLRALIAALRKWGKLEWSGEALGNRAAADGWAAQMLKRAQEEAGAFEDEVQRCAAGLAVLEEREDVRMAFRLMNEAFDFSGRRRNYTGWRPFQLGFLLSALPSLAEPDHEDREIADTLWFATGGGKTETYLALVVLACLLDRIRGKTHGITAWSRFPLRMLSLQQTQRFADALAGAELARRRHGIPGDTIRLGFLVGSSSTPNEVVEDPQEGKPWAGDPEMPERYRVLMRCPFCWQDSIEMNFDEAHWRLVHRCTNSECEWVDDEKALPFHLVDKEIYRYLPAVIVGTLDKAAMVSLQAGMRGFYGAPLGRCSIAHHGFTYAPRKASPNGCLVPRCEASVRALEHDGAAGLSPTLHVQDELHLLRDSLGAIDSHYETLLDRLSVVCGGSLRKVVASSATLAGYAEQAFELYRRDARSFPLAGPKDGHSFWSQETGGLLRRFVGLAPRGVTREFANDRLAASLQLAIRRLVEDPSGVAVEAGFDSAHAEFLVSAYGTHVVYGTRLGDVEAAYRSFTTQGLPGLQVDRLIGASLLDEVQTVLDRLENPEQDYKERLHIICASSMMSHGVDIDRFNVITLLGVPLQTAEFIQTTARIGRRWPGIVFVLHRMGVERDASVYRSFRPYVLHGNRFVEPVAITRRSRRVLDLTFGGLFEAYRLGVWEPDRLGRSNKRIAWHKDLRAYAKERPLVEADVLEELARALRLDPGIGDPLYEHLKLLVRRTFDEMNDPASKKDRVTPRPPMTSLRQVEDEVPIHLHEPS